MVFFPAIMLVLSESILRLQRDDRNLAEVLKIIRNLVMPLLASFIALTQVVGLDPNISSIRLLQSLLLLATIHFLLALANLLFFVGAGEHTWQANVPKLMRDLVRGFMILIGTAVVLSVVWKLNLGSLITALGVSSIVIGLALQDTLGNLFSGITLLFERPFKLGDWINIGGTIGKVTEVNWRAVHLTTRELELLIVPNTILAKEMFSNFNKPTRIHVEVVNVGFSYNDPPNKVKTILQATALETKGVLEHPKPNVQTINYNDSSVDYKVRLYLADYAKVPQIRDEFMTRIWYAAQRHGLEIPFPIRTVYHQPIPAVPVGVDFDVLESRLKIIPFFVNLASEDLQDLVHDSECLFYGAQEPIIAIGDRKIKLHLLLKGQVQVYVMTEMGHQKKAVELRNGEFFGTAALMSGEDSNISVKAIVDSEVLVLNTEAVHVLLARSPQLSQRLGEVIEARRRVLEGARRGAKAKILSQFDR